MKFWITWFKSRYFLVAGILVLVINILVGWLIWGVPGGPVINEKGSEVTIDGVIVNDPLVRGSGWEFVLRIGTETQMLQIHTDRGFEVQRGDRVSCTGTIEAVSGNNYYKIIEVSGIVYHCVNLHVLEKTSNPFTISSNLLRKQLSSFIDANFPEPAAGLLKGILIGLNTGYSDELRTALLYSGTGHIIAVSGFNIGFLVSLLLLIAGRLHRKTVILIAFPLLLFYVFLVGFDNIPALRALIFNCYLLAGVFFGRRPDPYNGLGLCLFIICLIYPQSYSSLSFQLSFSAFVGLLLLGPVFKRYCFWNSFSICLACTLATIPVNIIYFGVIYPWALPLNLLVAPLLPLILELALLSFPLALLIPQLANYFCLPLKLILDLLLKIIMTVNNLPKKTVEISLSGMIIGVVVLIILSIGIYKIYRFHATHIPN